MPDDFASAPPHPLLRLIDAHLAKQGQAMQRTRHADRRKETRKRLELGDAVIAAGAGHLSPAEIETILSSHRLVSDKTAKDPDSYDPASAIVDRFAR